MPAKYPNIIKSMPLYDGRFDAYQLDPSRCQVLFASYPAGTQIEMHSHETDNHGVITQGELILTMNGKVYRFGVGQWYHVPALTEHSAQFEQDTDEIEFWFK